MPVGLHFQVMSPSHNQTCPPAPPKTKEKGKNIAFKADMAGARSEELGGSTPSLLRALSGMGGTLYRHVCLERENWDPSEMRGLRHALANSPCRLKDRKTPLRPLLWVKNRKE